jgi:hypothetical protein
VDVRGGAQANDPLATGKLVGGGFHMFNVTHMDGISTEGYMSPLAINYGLTDGTNSFLFEMRNCFAYKNAYKNGNGFYANFGGTPDALSNNVDVELPMGSQYAVVIDYPSTGYLVDETTYAPDPAGPLIAQGMTIASIPGLQTDIWGKPRTGAWSAGAVQP